MNNTTPQGLYITDDGELFLSDAQLAPFYIAALALGVLVFLALERPWKKSLGRKGVPRLMSAFLALSTLCFVIILPIVAATQNLQAVAFIPTTVMRTIQAIFADNGFTDYITGLPNSPFGSVYYFTLGATYCALPVLTLLNVYELLVQNLDRLARFSAGRALRGCSNVLLFSALDEISANIALQALGEDANSMAVFCSVNKSDRAAEEGKVGSLGNHRVRFLKDSYPTIAAYLAAKYLCPSKADGAPAFHCVAVSPRHDENLAQTAALLSVLHGQTAYLDGRVLHLFTAEKAGGTPPCKHVGKMRLHCAFNGLNDEALIDSLNRGGRALNCADGSLRYSVALPVSLMKEQTLTSLSLLSKAPLFKALSQDAPAGGQLRPAAPETLNVLVLGSTNQAGNLLRTMAWYGQMHNVVLKLCLAGEGAKLQGDLLEMECPGLFSDSGLARWMDFSFVELNPLSRELDSALLAGLRAKLDEDEHLYVAVALDDDEDSYRCAMHIRSYFMENSPLKSSDALRWQPFIAALVRSSGMNYVLSQRGGEDVDGYAICTFGNPLEIYGYHSLVCSDLDRIGRRTNALYSLMYESISEEPNLSFDPIPIQTLRRISKKTTDACGDTLYRAEDIATFRQDERYSNMALALHVPYKAWSMGAEASDFDAAEALSDEAVLALGSCEHRRWCAFYYSQGWTYLNEADRVAYARAFHENALSKVVAHRKHVMLCPETEIFKHYMEACRGFAYPTLDAIQEGSCTLELSAPGCAQVQLLNENYEALARLNLREDGTGSFTGLAAGCYRVHPCLAQPGFCVPADSEAVQVDANAAARVQLKPASKCVNPAVYDYGFAMVAPKLQA